MLRQRFYNTGYILLKTVIEAQLQQDAEQISKKNQSPIRNRQARLNCDSFTLGLRVEKQTFSGAASSGAECWKGWGGGSLPELILAVTVGKEGRQATLQTSWGQFKFPIRLACMFFCTVEGIQTTWREPSLTLLLQKLATTSHTHTLWQA